LECYQFNLPGLTPRALQPASLSVRVPVNLRSNIFAQLEWAPHQTRSLSGPCRYRKALAELEKIKFIPASGSKRMTPMVAGRNDWCISRQRAWGVPIPCFYDKETKAGTGAGAEAEGKGLAVPDTTPAVTPNVESVPYLV
jgi:hypothetical protein